MEGTVRQHIPTAGLQLYLHCSSGHQGSPPGDITDPLKGVIHYHPVPCPNIIPGLRQWRDQIRLSSAIGDRVVDTHIIHDVFPKIIDAYIHQLHRIQSRTTHLRACGGMRGYAVEATALPAPTEGSSFCVERPPSSGRGRK